MNGIIYHMAHLFKNIKILRYIKIIKTDSCCIMLHNAAYHIYIYTHAGVLHSIDCMLKFAVTSLALTSRW